MFQKPTRWQSKRYEDWVRKQSCWMCGRDADQVHHIIGTGNLSGMGIKAASWAATPICSVCHHLLHNVHDNDIINRQPMAALKTIGQALNEGILKCG